MEIQWFPGHMTKTRRQMTEDIRQVDMVVEIIDARIPISSRNPDLDELTAGKPRMIILNRADQADPAMNRAWGAYFRSQGHSVLETDAKTGAGVKQFPNAARTMMKEKLEYYAQKGQTGRPLRAMVVGIPNVGKSTFINKVAGRKSAKAENRPGVTRGKQWVNVGSGLELLDTPGILWPKFEDQRIGMHLAYTGAIRDEIIDREELASSLMALLAEHYPETVKTRYKLELDATAEGWQLLEQAGRKRGFLISGGEVDLERMARVLLEEYRSGKLGRMTLERPEELGGGNGTDGSVAL
jgi:ribosome biogenesis GTPase A